MKILTYIFILILLSGILKAQPAPWVSYPSANQTAYGVYHFRKTFDLEKTLSTFIRLICDL